MTTAALDAARRFFAEEIQWAANVQTDALVEAFARVPREEFLGPGPWDIAGADLRRPGKMVYRRTPDADARHLYHNLPVAIDAARELNNGHPSSLASWLDALKLQAGDRVLHVGCGVGYYSAIIAAVVGSGGHVTAIEIDEALASRARTNLAGCANVTVVSGDGGTFRSDGPYDAIFVNAGFTHPMPAWLESLAEGGRLIVPITAALPGSPIGAGWMLLVTRAAWRFSAQFISPVAIFASPTGREEGIDGLLQQAFSRGAWMRAKSIRLDAHERADSCCIHADGSCVSAQ